MRGAVTLSWGETTMDTVEPANAAETEILVPSTKSHDRARARSAGELNELFAGWEITTAGTGSRDDELSYWQGAGLAYAHYAASAGASFRRERSGETAEPMLALAFIHTGGMTFTRQGRSIELGRRSVLAFRPELPHESINQPRTSMSFIIASASMLEARGIDVRRFDAIAWAGGELEAAVVALARTALDMHQEDTSVVQRGLTELVVSVLLRHMTSSADDALAHTRRRALAVIDEHYVRADLDAAAVARHLGVSRRYLYTLFEGRDASVASLIRSRRVSHADALLASGRDLSLRRIAELSGLGSEDRMLRTFKSVLGESPSERRKRLRAQADRA